MLTQGRPETSRIACNREPSGSCRFNSGSAASKRRSVRPIRAAAKRTISTSSASSSATGSTSTRRPVAVRDPDAVAAVGGDVGDVVVVEQWLEPAETEQAVVDGGGDRGVVVLG